MATLTHRFSIARRHLGWFLLAIVVLSVGIVDLTDGVIVVGDYLSGSAPLDPSMKNRSPITAVALGLIIAAAFAIWLTVRLVNLGKKPSTRFCACAVLALVVGALWILLSIWLPYDREQPIIRNIERLERNGKWVPGGNRGHELTRGGPDWLRRLVGYERMKVFDRVNAVHLDGSTIGDSDLDDLKLKELASLKLLSLNDTGVGDAGLAHLSGLTSLRILHLNKTQITDAGLAHLKGIPNLEELDIRETQVTDAGLLHLTGMKKLRVLWLPRGNERTDWQTTIGDAGLAHLSTLTNLEELDIYSTQVTDAGLLHLTGMKKLRVLELYGKNVGNAGLAQVSGLTNLRRLNISSTQVTDAGLVHLSKLTNLKMLHLSTKQVSDAGLLHLTGMKELRVLWLGCPNVGDAGLVHLRGLWLEQLRLMGTAVTATGIKELSKALPHYCAIHLDRQLFVNGEKREPK